MKNLHLALFFALMITSIPKASAWVFAEPIISYSTGSYKSETFVTSKESTNYDMKGFAYGLRAGLSLSFFQLGGEYSFGKYKVDTDDGLDIKTNEPWIFIGFKFWFLRLYTAVTRSIDIKGSDNDGDGLKYGITFYAFENVAISLEQSKIDRDFESEIDPLVLLQDEYNLTSLVISFPFEI